MTYDYKVLAGPIFFLLIGMEAWLSRRRGWGYYRLNDAVSDVSTSMLMQLVMLLSRGAVVAGYLAIHARFRAFDLPADRAWTWIACFLGVDFGYYWFHRKSHEINFLWAAHVVHHQSEDYNLAVALRQSTLQPFFGAIFYWPLALLGFPPVVFLACASFNTIYQFWLHTQAIGRLGPLEAVLVTPSHHRVHHGRNPRYIDRNHGGTFIVWDRLFGTFEREREAVVYGITKPLASWNPLWANLHYWVELLRTARRTPHRRDKLRAFLKPPGWYPADQGGFQPPPPVSATPVKFDRPHAPALGRYALLQFGLLVAATVALSFCVGMYDLRTGLAAIGVVGWGFGNLGGLFDGRAWAWRSEALRVVAAPAVPLLVLSGAAAWATAAALLLCVPFFWAACGRNDDAEPEAGWSVQRADGRSQ
ncbi:MAG: sterol desaturase family protein [Deltaproteobacteria bacterium]|nr:sterol desaturase family protein [Deltaproteobacteria bacterium]